MILEGPVLWTFFGACFWSQKIVKIIVVVSPGRAKRSIKMRLCSFVGALWCSKVPPDTFLDDFRSDLGWIWHVFQNVSRHFLCQKTCDRSFPPSAEKLFGAHFWHALGTKSAMTRTTPPQHSFSKGGGFAKHPQLGFILALILGLIIRLILGINI